MSASGGLFHPFVSSSIHPSSSSPKNKMMEEEEEGGRRRTNGNSSSLSKCLCGHRSVLTSPIGGEELGPLRAMTAIGVGLSLALNTAVASTSTQRISPATEKAEG